MRIDASPTKEFFIFMLTRDVQLSRAIIDLVDNCVDGANRLRDEGRFDGLWVRIALDRDKFTVEDNCGGIPVAVARDYAFRFGRPRDAKDTPHSMGLFGVGMKRTFFKLGQQFSVRSRCKTEAFTLNVDVNEWIAGDSREGADDWHFTFSSVDEHAPDVSWEETGTVINVQSLYPAVADTFALETFHQQLASELEDAHSASLERGLSITVNRIPVNFVPQKLLRSDLLAPAFVEKEYSRKALDGRDGDPVHVKLYAGIATRDYHQGGWYVFCNGRLIVKADKSATTIWGSAHNVRQYHPDFAYFRGYAFFDCQQASLLPWTTTKTGIDTDSVLYKNVQREMIELSKPVLGFLSDLAKERSGESEEDNLEAAITNASAIEVKTIKAQTTFVAPMFIAGPKGPPMQWIRYRKPAPVAEKAKALLHAITWGEVGERTFDYYMRYEGEE